MSWTDERVELLRKLWLEGLSASQIAAELADGLTRNAVIGKVHRLGLSGRTKGAATAGDDAPMQEEETPQDEHPALHIQQAEAASPVPIMPVIVGNTVLNVAVEEEPAEAQAPVPEPHRTIDVVIPLSERVTILELRESTCRWPIGDPTQPEFRFCGAYKAPGSGPYCSHHAGIAYQPQQDRRRAAKMQQKSA